jgi:hypothetical protein
MFTSLLRLLALASIVVTIAACSSSASSAHNSPASSVHNSEGGHESEGLCGGGPSGYLATARIVFVGVMLPGATVRAGGRNVLVSPARVRVVRYLKGTGPSVVTVSTGVTRTGSTRVGSEDGIQPQAGERWRIYTTSQHAPYQTSICGGSILVGSTG